MHHLRVAHVLLTAFGLSAVVSFDANAGTVDYDTGYKQAAWLLCPHHKVIYNSAGASRFIGQDIKSRNSRDYQHGFAAFKAVLKGGHSSELCFASARASGWWTTDR
jgi:hypothetical protein